MRKGKSGGHEEIMCTARAGEEMMRMVSRGSYWNNRSEVKSEKSEERREGKS